jgi:D-alanine-D-alanine ligase
MTQTDTKTVTAKYDASKEVAKVVNEKIIVEKTIVEKTSVKYEFVIDKDQIKKFKLIAVAFSHVEREMFPNKESYEAEIEVEERAKDVIKEIEKLGITAKGYPGDQYLLTNLLVDHPDLVFNLVDTLKGKDSLQTSVPAALELANIPYTGAEMQGLVIGNDRNLIKRLLMAYEIPTPPFQFIRYAGTSIREDLGTPLIVKLNESGGSVGIDNHAVKDTIKDAQKKVDDMISTYKIPVVVEKFISGPEITAIVFEDKQKKHVILGQKIFKDKPDGKYYFTSYESYEHMNSYKYKTVDEPLASKISKLAVRAFNGLRYKDYAKFDIRVDEETGIPYFTDCNPNTAIGPDKGLPFTEVLDLHDIKFEDFLASLLTKYAKILN